MFFNFIKVGFRNLIKNRTVSIINILGLSFSVGIAITTFIFIDFQKNFDRFHSKKDDIYQVISVLMDQENLQMWAESPILMGPQIKEKHQSVKHFTRFVLESGTVKYRDKIFNERLTFADADYMKMFDFPIKYGDKSVLNNKENIIISDLIAEKYFGSQNPVGRDISIKFSNGKILSFIIDGVFDKMPNEASFGTDFLISIQNFFDLRFKERYDWSDQIAGTFIEMESGHQSAELENVLSDVKDLQNLAAPKRKVVNYELLSLANVSQESYKIRRPVSSGGHPAGQITLAIIAILLLVMSCFNYINITISSEFKRLKEIGIRKVMGSSKRDIIYQFLVENFIQCVISFIVATVLSYFILLPGLNIAFPITIPFSFSSLPTALTFLFGLLLFVGFASGAYPAYYISRFEPSKILKNDRLFGKTNIVSRVFISVQLTFAFIVIVACFVFTDQAFYFQNKHWGYKPNDVLFVLGNDVDALNSLKNKAEGLPQVMSAAISVGHIGRDNKSVEVDHLDKKFNSFLYKADASYAQTMNLILTDGKYLETELSDDTNDALVNETFVNSMGWETPLNQSFKIENKTYRVKGVLKDFIQNNFYGKIQPSIIVRRGMDSGTYLLVKTEYGKLKGTDDELKSQWAGVQPFEPYISSYQEDILDRFYTENEANILVLLFISIISIILSSLGLFGLLSSYLIKQKKQLAIRKVLGATAGNIVGIVNRQFIWVIVISFMIGGGLGFYMMNLIIKSVYPDPKPFSFNPFVVSFVIVIITIAITFAGQVIKTIRGNPTETLRSN